MGNWWDSAPLVSPPPSGAEFSVEQQRALAQARARKRRSEQAGDPNSWPTFEVEGPDGALYELQAPDMEAAASGFRKYMGRNGAGDGKEGRLPGMSAQQHGSIPPAGGTLDELEAIRLRARARRRRAEAEGKGSTWERYQKQPTADEARRELARRELARRRGQTEGGQNGLNDAAHVATGGLIEGIPVVGPYIREGADRVGAGIRSWMHDTPFQDELDFVQGRSQQLSAERPILDTASKIGGAVAGTVPMVMAAPTAFGASGGGLIGRTLWSAGTGTALGTADSGVRSDWDPEAMMWGGGAGFVGGAIAPAAGKAIGAGWQRLRDWRAARGAVRSSGLDKGTLARLGRAVRDDGMDPAALGQRMRELGPDAMLMDAGPNLQQQAGALAATPGRGQEVVRSALDARHAGSAGRIGGALDDALGQSADTLALADDIVTQRATAARPLYQRAYQEGAEGVWSPELQRMAGSPMFSDAMRGAATRGQDRAVLDGFGSFNPRVSVSPDGRIAFNQTRAGGSPLYPDLQYWDYVKRELDDIAGAAARAGRREEAGIASNLASRLRNELDSAVPSYRAAREAYSGPSAILDALEEGQSVFRNTTTPGQLRRQMQGMGQAERDAFIQGARSQIADIMGTARNDAGAARALFQRGFNRDKLNILLGEQQAGQLLQRLEAETAFAGTRDVVTRNSLTASRQAAMKEMGIPTGPQFGVREGYMSGGTLGAARSAGMRTFEQIRDALMNGVQQSRNSGLAEALSAKDYSGVVEALKQSQGGRAVNQPLVDEIARALMFGGGIGAARP